MAASTEPSSGLRERRSTAPRVSFTPPARSWSCSFVPGAGTAKVRWSRQTIDRALRAGLQRAAHELAGSGIAGNVLGFGLSQLVAPSVESLLGQAK